MDENRTIPMTRARLFVLIDAFERDIRDILSRYVLSEMDEATALGPSFGRAAQRRTEDEAASDETPLPEYLDLREAYDLLNTHRGLLPEELAREVRELTSGLDRLVAIRKRVMHARPLLAGDSDAAPSLLVQYRSRWWKEMQRTLAQLDSDPTWEPVVQLQIDSSLTLHNLPLPEYDETGLVGRSKEVADLVGLLKRRREAVVTVTGEGGIGKTALALEVAYNLVDDHSRPFDAVLWTSLKNERLTPSGIQEIIGAAHDLTGAMAPLGEALDSGFDGTVQELAEAVEGLRVLIVVDNLETLGGREFSAMYDTLPADVTYLVTSRIGVGEFERRYPLASLSQRDALSLFNDFVRSRQLHPLARLSTPTRQQIVEKLRFSPLVIRWFILAVEAGNDPLSLIRDQAEVLEFCVRSVYDALSPQAQEVLVGLSVLGRPLSPDELVLLLDTHMDDINSGLQELVRGALVRRHTSSQPGDLTLIVQLTDTATQFLTKRVSVDLAMSKTLTARDAQYRAHEERRSADQAARSLAPSVIRVRGPQDAPTAQLLRRALLLSRDGNMEGAFSELEIAKKLNPDFWEVDRIEGFLRGTTGEYAVATVSYQAAYRKVDTDEARGVVAHFLAAHLSRNLRDTQSAIPYAREAHALLGYAETAVGLGNLLVWTRAYAEGVDLLEAAVPIAQGRFRLIAISALSQGYRRWGEYAGSEERNPVVQFSRSSRGFNIAIAALGAGVTDDKLRDAAADCATTAVIGAHDWVASGQSVVGMGDWLDALSGSLVRLAGTQRWQRLVGAIIRLAKQSRAPVAAGRLLEAARGLGTGDDGGDLTLDSRLVGEVVGLQIGYGFIRHPRYSNNLFFHANDLAAGIEFSSLRSGMLLAFSPVEGEKGARAQDVSRP